MHPSDFFFNQVVHNNVVEVEPTPIDEVRWSNGENMVRDMSSGQITFNNLDGLSVFTFDSPRIYGGCKECYHFSMVFGGVIYNKTHEKIETEEDFEIVKSDIVEHLNKEHPDLVAKKRAAKPVKKKFEKVKQNFPLRHVEFRLDDITSSYETGISHMNYISGILVPHDSRTTATPSVQAFRRSLANQAAEERWGGFRSRRTNRYEV